MRPPDEQHEQASRADNGGETAAPRFVAYAYPGWHESSYRPGVDEWALLDEFVPRFRGHQIPPLPADGRYDDSTPETARRHRDLALSAGIEGFTYFVYYQPDVGFVMADPIYRMTEVTCDDIDPFSIGATWCIRLPHDHFPVSPGDELDLPDRTTRRADLPLADRPIESMSLADIDELLGPEDRVWSTTLVEGGFLAATARRRRALRGGADAAPRHEVDSDEF